MVVNKRASLGFLLADIQALTAVFLNNSQLLGEELLEEFFLFVGDFVRQVHDVSDKEISRLAVLLEHGHALPLEALHQARLRDFVPPVNLHRVTIQVLYSFLETEQRLFESDVDARFQVVILTLKHRVVQLYHFDVDVARPYVDELIGGVFIGDHMTIWSAFLHPDHEAVHGVRQRIAFAQVANRFLYFAISGAPVALSLKLLNHARTNLLSFDHHA